MLMAFVLALSLLPTAAFAAGGGTLKEAEQRTTPMSSQRLTSWRALRRN